MAEVAAKRKIRTSGRDKVFMGFVYLFLTVSLLVVFLPLMYVVSASFSDSRAVVSGEVWLLPVRPTLKGYTAVFENPQIVTGFINSFIYMFAGTAVSLVLTVLAAYPLSRKELSGRKLFNGLFLFTMLFSGGMIPAYLLVRELKLMDTLWALVLPGAVPVFNVVILMNYYRSLPAEIEEAAIVDGASQWRIMWRIWTPLALPSIATLTLFSLVGHWNSWFDGIIYMNFPENYPLQSYLRTVIQKVDTSNMTMEQWRELAGTSERTLKAAQIMIASLPMLLFYPFLQRYFIKGITIGGVKG